jgi:phosphotriesterase-related protein
LRAAARAQAATNVALSVHLPGWERHGHRVLDIIEEEGGHLDRTILDHMNPSGDDVAYQTSLADRGAYLEYDMMGMTYKYPPNKLCPDDSVTVGAIKQLIDDGVLERILMSQDVFLKSQFKRYGGIGFIHIFTTLRTQYERLGIGEGDLATIFTKNSQRILAFMR